MEFLILFLVILFPLSGVVYWVVARHRLVKHVGSNYPSLWWELRVSDAAGEISGFPPELARWVATDVGQPNDPIGLMTGLGSTFYFVRDSELHSIEINSGNQASRVGTDSWDNVTAMTGVRTTPE